jgi:hypothetical protein
VYISLLEFASIPKSVIIYHRASFAFLNLCHLLIVSLLVDLLFI